jgi:D-glycero-D-manno-heptose 1,7-bisphosphate phosphatase
MGKALFLDRDGVINIEKEGSYIFNKSEFEFYEGALKSLAHISTAFDYTIIVTNQRGVGRGLMSVADLEEIHKYLKASVQKEGGVIHEIYYAPNIERDHPMRKPNTGMAMLAKADYPDIDFLQSVMVGNNISDMQFGKTLGMHTIFLHTTQHPIELPHPLVDEQYGQLKDWVAAYLSNI